MENILYYKREANTFEEALPIGNGRMGAMVYSKTCTERISLNDDTLWSGSGKQNSVPPYAPKAFKAAQELVLCGKLGEAQEVLSKEFYSMWSQIYLPLGDIILNFGHENVSEYLRTLDFETGLCRTQYICEHVLYTREVFASFPDDVIVIKICSDKPAKLNFSFTARTPLKTLNKTFSNNILSIEAIAPSNGCKYSFVQKDPLIYTDELGIEFSLCSKIDSDGQVFEKENHVYVKDATNAVIYICSKTNFDDISKGVSKRTKDYIDKAFNAVLLLKLSNYDEILKTHIADFSSLYNRVKLNLGKKETDLDIYERLKNFDEHDFGLYELLFGYGRYLTLSSSRKGTQATNLQGIWNEKLVPPWSSNYTLNINTEMNYWPVFNTNLAECFEPFVALAEKLRKTGTETAKDYYNARGFVSHHNTDIWGMSNPVGYGQGPQSCAFVFWNMSSGWICCQLFDLYEYTLDKDMLRKIYPIMRDAALFYTDIIYKDENGYYMICPSTSPENRYEKNGSEFSVSKTTAMTTSILRELFTKVIKASEILDKDDELVQTLKALLPNIYPLRITSDKRMMEWAEEETEIEIHHRHISHLFGLYPGNLITLKDTPELADVCRQSLLVRGDDGTGWSLSWKINLWAYLQDGNHALKLIQRQLRLVEPTDDTDYTNKGGTFANMFDAHPPFQIDGNFGSCAAICNMLVQSKLGYIHLLPALPDLWKDGNVSGIVAKGHVIINMEWKAKMVTHLSLKTPNAQKITLYVNNSEIETWLDANTTLTIL